MTTPRAANSSVLSMPAKASDESAALPAGPVTYDVEPVGTVGRLGADVVDDRGDGLPAARARR